MSDPSTRSQGSKELEPAIIKDHAENDANFEREITKNEKVGTDTVHQQA